MYLLFVALIVWNKAHLFDFHLNLLLACLFSSAFTGCLVYGGQV